ncbi:MAG: RagB/SusD family nutrient uptake outer membrane protein, partial [Tannerella sp.]|nr:RagB/SusD family nutrient uptake outer membrane protein [Tannerella sp.]
MKIRIIIIASFICTGCLFSSCDSFLNQENPNKITASDYFQTENDVLRAVNGIYRSIRDNYCLGEGSTAYTEERSDNLGMQDNQSNAGEPFQFGDYSLLPTNTFMKTHWTRMFTAIANANFVLTYIDGVKFADEELRKQYRAEAKFLRALVYFHVVRKWGDVPLSTTHLTSPDEVSAKTFREKKETVYGQIVKDLAESLDAGNLPDLQPESGRGRTCKAAINALL